MVSCKNPTTRSPARLPNHVKTPTTYIRILLRPRKYHSTTGLVNDGIIYMGNCASAKKVMISGGASSGRTAMIIPRLRHPDSNPALRAGRFSRQNILKTNTPANIKPTYTKKLRMIRNNIWPGSANNRAVIPSINGIANNQSNKTV